MQGPQLVSAKLLPLQQGFHGPGLNDASVPALPFGGPWEYRLPPAPESSPGGVVSIPHPILHRKPAAGFGLNYLPSTAMNSDSRNLPKFQCRLTPVCEVSLHPLLCQLCRASPSVKLPPLGNQGPTRPRSASKPQGTTPYSTLPAGRLPPADIGLA